MKKAIHLLAIIATTSLLLASCVPTRRWKASEAALAAVRADSARLAQQLTQDEATIGQLKQQIGDLNTKITDLQNQSGLTQSQLNQSKEQIAEQRRRLAQLQALMDQQKRAIQDIRKKMTDALVGFNSSDLS